MNIQTKETERKKNAALKELAFPKRVFIQEGRPFSDRKIKIKRRIEDIDLHCLVDFISKL